MQGFVQVIDNHATIAKYLFIANMLGVDWGEPERAPRDHDVYCTCVRAYVPAYVHTYVHVGEACLGTSEDDVALCTQCTSGIDYAH